MDKDSIFVPMDVFLLILGLIFMIIGLAGALLPILPGLPLAYLGLLLLHWSEYGQFTGYFLLIWALVVVILMIIEYLIPKWGAKKYGGTKAGQTGAFIGTIAGVFIFPPLGLLLGPFVGAYVGELIDDSEDNRKALRSAWGSLMGFMAGSLLKVVTALVMLFFFLREWLIS